MDNTIYIYGHKHNHNLIKPREEYSYDHILRDPVRSAKAKWAITPVSYTHLTLPTILLV